MGQCEIVAGGTGFIGQVGAQNSLVGLIAQQICAGINDGIASLSVMSATDVATQSVGAGPQSTGREI